jgi:hypothetical protein
MLLDQQVGPEVVQSTKEIKAIIHQYIFYSANNIQDNMISCVHEHNLDHTFQWIQNIYAIIRLRNEI